MARAGGRLAATHRHSAPTSDRADWHRCDLADGGAAIAALIDSLRPRAVINAAYVQHGDELEVVTAQAPGAMAAACRRVGSRLVHVSTDVVFDGTTDRPYVESDPPSPVHDYGNAKAEAEARVLAAHPDAVVVRTSLLWGGADDPGPQVQMTAEPGITFFDDEFRNPLEVGLLAAALLELTERPEIVGVLHVAGADTVDRFEFARRVCRLVGVEPEHLSGGPGSVHTARPSNCPLDSSRAASLLDTRLRGVREATA